MRLSGLLVAARFVVASLLDFPNDLWTTIRLSGHLRALALTLQLWATGALTQLAIQQGASGALHLGGLLQTICSLQWAQADKAAVVVALMVRHKLLKYFRRGRICETLVSGTDGG